MNILADSILHLSSHWVSKSICKSEPWLFFCRVKKIFYHTDHNLFFVLRCFQGFQHMNMTWPIHDRQIWNLLIKKILLAGHSLAKARMCSNDLDCPHCLGPYQNPIVRNWGHVLCETCLMRWLIKTKNCPVCPNCPYWK